MSKKVLSYGRQWISEEDIQSVVEVLRAGFITQGPKVEEFEKKLAENAGVKYAVVCNSATSGLHIACLAAGVGSGDEVITSPITFVASSNCAFYVGATPVFADVDERTALINPREIEKVITPKTKAIIPVHFAGQSADMVDISRLAQEAGRKAGRKVYVIEDAAHAIGGSYKGHSTGSCAYSDMVVYSFHPVKQITTGEGGAVLTNDRDLYQKLLMFRSHGITRDPELVEDTSTFPWGYEQHELGYNYRLTDIQCALGISQLGRLKGFIDRRRQIAKMYREAFNGTEIGVLVDLPEVVNAYHLFVVSLPFEKLGGRQKVMMELREKGIIAQVHYIPVHTQPFYRKKLGYKRGDFPQAEKYYSQCLSIPMYPAMEDEDVYRVVKDLKSLFS
ncbi:MAG: UDP-4-amino-4,6-dideoxy-N-acetyl-beta-L-altrosamine transaminase [Oligoflexia bacterium]|nr:UDP-4-amino-4,6-dideoxy-N-acetyl-beta-L-altrosamine transaminase [Oligoflexia bacterium]